MLCIIFRNNILVTAINLVLIIFGPLIIGNINSLTNEKYHVGKYWILAVYEKINCLYEIRDMATNLLVLAGFILFSIFIGTIAIRKKELI
jgi:hypothetical protein